MNVGVGESKHINVLSPKMFHPLAIKTFGVKLSDIPNIKSADVPEDDINKPFEINEDEVDVLGTIMAQMSLKEGLRQFGDRTEAAATKEMKQLHDMDTFFPQDPKSLTREERIQTLSSQRRYQGTHVYQRRTTTRVHQEGRCDISHGCNGFNIHHRGNRRLREQRCGNPQLARSLPTYGH